VSKIKARYLGKLQSTTARLGCTAYSGHLATASQGVEAVPVGLYAEEFQSSVSLNIDTLLKMEVPALFDNTLDKSTAPNSALTGRKGEIQVVFGPMFSGKTTEVSDT
jgi:hypothetical protein